MSDLTPLEVQQSLSDALDKALLASILGGEATAAELNVARQRLKDLGISKIVTPGSDLARLADEISKGGFMPALVEPTDDEPDEATDGIERATAEV